MPPLRRLLVSRAWLFAVGFAVFAYLFHDYGNTRGLYTAYWWFQIAAHYVSATALALLLARTGLDMGLDGRRLDWFIVAFAAVGALGWEVVEYLGIFENLHFWGIQDSLIDLAADAVGVATILVLVRKQKIRRFIDPTVETPSLSSLVASNDRDPESK